MGMHGLHDCDYGNQLDAVIVFCLAAEQMLLIRIFLRLYAAGLSMGTRNHYCCLWR